MRNRINVKSYQFENKLDFVLIKFKNKELATNKLLFSNIK